MFDGDSVEGIREKAFDTRDHVKTPGKTLKNFERNKEKVKAFGDELIRFVITDASGQVIPKCSWRLARRKLQFVDDAMELLYDIVRKSPAEIDVIEYFEELETGAVVFPRDMFKGLEPVPAVYRIVPRRTREPDDRAFDPHYEGDVYLFLIDVPTMTDNNSYAVTTADLEAYLRYGLQEEDHRIEESEKKIREKVKEIAHWDKKIRNVGYETLVGPDMKVITDVVKQEKERQARYEHYQKEKIRTIREKEEEEANLEKLKGRFDVEAIYFEKLEEDPNSQLAKYRVTVDGPQAERLTEVLMNKNDWQGISMAVTSKVAPTWVGRGAVPSASRFNEPDLKAYEVNIQNIKLARWPHGFGTWLQTETQNDGRDFVVYHGQWRFGERHGRGIEYGNAGIYSGPFQKNAKQGQARKDFANGDIVVGDFACLDRLARNTDLNPYNTGNPHGVVSITFSDGGYYEGEMEDGVVNGRGKYVTSKGDIYEGHFSKGRLHGKGIMKLVHGETFQGVFRHGKLDGYGHFHNKYGDRYDGYWKVGQKVGRGLQVYRNNDQYQGYFVNDTKTGRGVQHFQNVHTKIHESSDAPILVADRRHEGNWAAGEVEPRGMVTTYPFENTWYTAQECRNTFPYLLKLKREEEIWTKRLQKRRERIVENERVLRQELIHRKFKIFEAQLEEAKKMANAYVAGRTSVEDLRSSYTVREKRLSSYVTMNNIEGDELDEFWEKMQTNIGEAADSVDDIAEQQRTDSRRTLLISLVQSAFEEMEERQKLLNVERIAEKAKAEALAVIAMKNRKEKTEAEQSAARLQASIDEHRRIVMSRASAGRALRRHLSEDVHLDDPDI